MSDPAPLEGAAAADELERLICKAGGVEFSEDAPEGTADRVRREHPQLVEEAERYYAEWRRKQRDLWERMTRRGCGY